jgi:hypothetical protein
MSTTPAKPTAIELIESVWTGADRLETRRFFIWLSALFAGGEIAALAAWSADWLPAGAPPWTGPGLAVSLGAGAFTLLIFARFAP